MCYCKTQYCSGVVNNDQAKIQEQFFSAKPSRTFINRIAIYQNSIEAPLKQIPNASIVTVNAPLTLRIPLDKLPSGDWTPRSPLISESRQFPTKPAEKDEGWKIKW